MKRILYIEDNLPTQLMVGKHLRQMGELTVGNSLAEGRRLLDERTFDLLISDVNLPDGNALEMVNDLRRRSSPEQFPIILVSASMDQLLRAKSLRAGANDCFSMPTPWPVLLQAVQRILEQPYTHSSDPNSIPVTYVEGIADSRFWIFCPEMNLRLEGDTLETLRDEMAERVRTAIKSGTVLPFVSRVRVAERLVKMDGSS